VDFAPTILHGELPALSGVGLDVTFVTCCGSLTVGVVNDRGSWAGSVAVDLERRPAAGGAGSGSGAADAGSGSADAGSGAADAGSGSADAGSGVADSEAGAVPGTDGAPDPSASDGTTGIMSRSP